MAKRGKHRHGKGGPGPGAPRAQAPEPAIVQATHDAPASASAEEAEAAHEERAGQPAQPAAAEAPAASAAPLLAEFELAGQSPFLVLAEYERRSLAHVVGLPEQLDAPGLWRGIAYRVGARRLASGFGEVVEILALPALTPVPGTQPWMLGVANVRGTLLPVVDLKQFLEGERTVLHEGQRVLVVRQPGGDVAVTIDELYGQRSFMDGDAADPAAAGDLAAGRYAHFIERAFRLDGQLWGQFSLDRLARTPEFRQAAA